MLAALGFIALQSKNPAVASPLVSEGDWIDKRTREW